MKRSVVVFGLLAAISAGSAHAAVVTFDDAAGQAATGGYQPGESFSDGGLTFTYGASSSASMYLWDASGFGPATGSNGTNTLLVGSTASDLVTITATNGSQFSLASLLLGINEPNSASETSDAVLVNGIRQSITTMASTYSFNTGSVLSVTISGLVNGGYVSIDNVNYQVPEPASLALIGVSLAGLVFARRSKHFGQR